jgi:carotenoid cleavage dioxygenase-like enzyme
VYGVFLDGTQGLAGRIGRLELATGAVDAWDPGAGRLVSEPVFVPRPGAGEEGAGWLVALAYDPDRRASDAVVLDAQALAAGPVCTAHLPVSTGITFHGAWRRAA